jgi:hypothetical protein
VLYHRARGVHTSVLVDEQDVLVVAEAIGRHNTLDRIQGECLIRGLPTADRLPLTTGRIASTSTPPGGWPARPASRSAGGRVGMPRQASRYVIYQL